jgi:lipopolysaccharide biosynthesis regulator YciM
VPRGGGMGKWIAIGALVVIAAASAVIFYVLKKDKPSGEAVATIDAGAPVVTPLDGGTAVAAGPDAAPAKPSTSDALETARAALYSDVRERAKAAELQLAGVGEDPEVMAMRARLSTAVAQALEDEAKLASDKGAAAALRKQAASVVMDAMKLAQRAQKAAPTSVMANAALADLLRLQGKPYKDVKKYLDAPGPAAATDREITLVAAMLELRDKHMGPAREQLAKLDAAPSQPGSMELTGDVRPRFQTAMLAALDGNTEAAKAQVQTILTAQPDHPGARALDAKLSGMVATSDPMPPELGSNAGTGTGSGKTGNPTSTGGNTGGSTGGSTGGGTSDDNFDRVLAKANAAAENSCGQAMPLYERALELKPNSVEALTGVGYCHLDAKQFQAAYSKFRAALMISPRYERALWGVAEMYQQQGRSEQAIEGYCKYLSVFEGNQAAQKQLDKLGGKCGGDGGGDSGKSSGDSGKSGGDSGGATGGGDGSASGGDSGKSGGDSGGGGGGAGAGAGSADTPASGPASSP